MKRIPRHRLFPFALIALLLWAGSDASKSKFDGSYNVVAWQDVKQVRMPTYTGIVNIHKRGTYFSIDGKIKQESCRSMGFFSREEKRIYFSKEKNYRACNGKKFMEVDNGYFYFASEEMDDNGGKSIYKEIWTRIN